MSASEVGASTAPMPGLARKGSGAEQQKRPHKARTHAAAESHTSAAMDDDAATLSQHVLLPHPCGRPHSGHGVRRSRLRSFFRGCCHCGVGEKEAGGHVGQDNVVCSTCPTHGSLPPRTQHPTVIHLTASRRLAEHIHPNDTADTCRVRRGAPQCICSPTAHTYVKAHDIPSGVVTKHIRPFRPRSAAFGKVLKCM